MENIIPASLRMITLRDNLSESSEDCSAFRGQSTVILVFKTKGLWTRNVTYHSRNKESCPTS